MGEFCVCELYLKDMKGKEKKDVRRKWKEREEGMMGGWESEKKGGVEGEINRELKWIPGDYLRK